MSSVPAERADPPRPRHATTFEPTAAVLVDAHVHLHPQHRLDTLLDSASRNLGRVRSRDSGSLAREEAASVLLLTEIDGASAFERLASSGASPPEDAGAWRFEPTAEPLSLVARASGREPLIVIRGRQIATREGLEVLALLFGGNVPDGLALEETIARVQAEGGVAAIPWGFGKWWGERGRMVERSLRRHTPGTVFLGDNGGRPRLAPEPTIFGLARRLGHAILPGSDPLPLRGHEIRPGSYGFAIEMDLDRDEPATSLREALLSTGPTLPPFGRRRPLLAFARDQIAMQRRKRSRRTS